MYGKRLTIDAKTIFVYVTRVVVLGGLLLVALAGCGKEDNSNVQRGRFRQTSKRRPSERVPMQRRTTLPGEPQRGPLG